MRMKSWNGIGDCCNPDVTQNALQPLRYRAFLGGGLTHGAIPRLFSVQVKFLAHNMIRNLILCNNSNANRWLLAYMYIHVQILPGYTHSLLYTLKPIKKPPYLNTPSLPEVLRLFVLSLCLHVQLQNLTYKYDLHIKIKKRFFFLAAKSTQQH